MKPTDADLLSYIQNDRKLYSVKHILLLTQDPETGEPLDEAAAAEKKAQAEDLLRQLRESSDPAALFDQLMNDYSEDTGLATNPGRLSGRGGRSDGPRVRGGVPGPGARRDQ